MYIQKPRIRAGKWVVVIKENRSPFSKDVEVLICSTREDAWQTYFWALKNK